VGIQQGIKASGWTIERFDPERPLKHYMAHALAEFPTTNGPADYALVVQGQVLGTVEAKRVTLGPYGVLTQAERYARGFEGSHFDFDGRHVPFLFSTNGEVIWFQDVRHELNVARRVLGFPTPGGLSEKLSREFDEACTWFRLNSNQHPRLRPYQMDANAAIEEAVDM